MVNYILYTTYLFDNNYDHYPLDGDIFKIILNSVVNAFQFFMSQRQILQHMM